MKTDQLIRQLLAYENVVSDTERPRSCVVDNPVGMRRELWVEGRLEYSMDAIELVTKGGHGIPAWFIPVGTNIGEWEPGQYVGDLRAIGDDEAVNIIRWGRREREEKERKETAWWGDGDKNKSRDGI